MRITVKYDSELGLYILLNDDYKIDGYGSTVLSALCDFLSTLDDVIDFYNKPDKELTKKAQEYRDKLKELVGE